MKHNTPKYTQNCDCQSDFPKSNGIDDSLQVSIFGSYPV